MKKLILSLFVTVLFANFAFAQNRTITGTVTDAEDGAPLPGVSVRITGASGGSMTNADGKYTLSVPSNSSTLQFSFIGYISVSRALGTSNVLNVALAGDSKQLGEVVVTALGISRDKKSLGYATQGLTSDQLTSASNSSLGGSLQGKVSGVEVTPSSGMPGASAKITIRGSRSFTGNNTPLYVVDGLPINSAPDLTTGNSVTGADIANRGVDIDPNDIETINILKGQAASALYGMRASNGVIIITTKSGKGAGKGKPQISYNTNVSFDKVSVTPEFQTTYAQGTTANGYVPTASTSWGPRIDQLQNDPVYGGNTNNAFTNGNLTDHAGMYYVRQRALAGLDPWATPQAYDNAGEFFRTGHTYNNSINIVQASDKGSYAVTLGNTNSAGIIPSTGMNRYNAKLAGELKMSDHWTTGFTGNLVNSRITKQSGANNGIMATLYGAPASYDLGGIPSNVAGDPYTQNTYRGTGGFDGVYWAVANNQFKEKTQRFFGNTYVNFTSGLGTSNQKLNLKYQIGADSYTTNYTDIFGYGHANGAGDISEYSYTVNELNSLFTASYNWTINNDLVFDALVGNEFINRDSKYLSAYGQNFNFPGFNHMNNATIYSSSSEYLKRRTFGTFASASLAYKSMLFLNVTGRNDVISSMPRDNRSFYYPSASLSWIFTELEPLKNRILTYGKLRASIAQVGQAGNYLPNSYGVPVFGGGFSGGTPILYPIGGVSAYTLNSTVYDPNLKPQNTTSYELGTDLTFFGGVATLGYTFSRQNVVDQIFSVPLAASTGYSSYVTNGGKIHTNAHEITLGFKPIDKQNFKWDFAFNFSKIDNYVDALATGVESIFLGGFTEPQVRASIGEKFPAIYGVSYLRNDAGQIVVDAQGFPQAGPEQVIGRVSPDFLLGFNTSFEIHKLRISAVLDWKQGGQMYSGTTGILDFYGVSKYSGDVRTPGTSFLFPEAAVKVSGTDANGNAIYAPNDIAIPGENAQNYFTALNSISESSIYDNSFVKLREVSLAYPVYAKKGFNVNLNVFARNILVWSSLKGIDPETSQGNSNMSGAFERFSLPGTSSYGFGLNVKF